MKLQQAHGEAVAAYLSGDENYSFELSPNTWGGWYPVWMASLNGRLAVVEWLLAECGANARATRRDDGSSAVHAAAQNGHVGVVRALVNAGGSVGQAKEDGGVTPLYAAVQARVVNQPLKSKFHQKRPIQSHTVRV